MTAQLQDSWPENLKPVVDRLQCPECKTASLTSNSPTFLCCESCQSEFAVVDGLPIFYQAAVEAGKGCGHFLRYQKKYLAEDRARSYDRSFRKSWRKRRRTVSEVKILERLLSATGNNNTVLDIPCGGGRLSPPIAKHCNILVEADVSPAQITVARNKHAQPQDIVWMSASATNLPFRSESVDTVVCARLSHHMPESEQRAALLSELLRVANRYVIISFTDRRSVVSLSRRVRGKAINPCASTTQELGQFATRRGARIVRTLSVSVFGSRHRFTLFEK